MNITPDQVTAIIVALTGLVAALTGLIAAVVRLWASVHNNSRRIVQLSEKVDQMNGNGNHDN